MPTFYTIITLSLMDTPFSHSPEENVLLRLLLLGREQSATCLQTVPVFSIIFSKIINEL